MTPLTQKRAMRAQHRREAKKLRQPGKLNIVFKSPTQKEIDEVRRIWRDGLHDYLMGTGRI